MTSEHVPDREGPRGPRAWALAALAAISVRNAAIGVFLVVLLVSLPFGGMRAASQPKRTVLHKDRAIAATPFTITYKGAWQTTDIGDLAETPTLTDGSHYVIVGALVRTTAKTSVPYDTLRDAVRLVGVPGVPRQPLTILVDADFHPMGDLPPRLTYGLYWVWQQKPGRAVPTKLTVAVESTTYRRSSLDETMGYFDPVEEARGRFPVAVWQTLMPAPVAGGGSD